VWGMSVRLPERVGTSRAKELMFTSRRISGVDAAAIGLIDRYVNDDRLDGEVASLAAEIVANSPGTNRIAKALLLTRPERTRQSALEHERTVPFGRPDDTAERMQRWLRR
jgi:enoyl-CoA hydratase